jgi:hypothetical protein
MDTETRPIPEERELSAEEYRLTRWILEHGVREAERFLEQPEQTRVVARCGCGCASVDFGVAGESAFTGASYTFGDFLCGTDFSVRAAAEPGRNLLLAALCR